MFLKALNDCSLEGSQLNLPSYQIPKSEYGKVKRAITGIGGTWNQKTQSFHFIGDPSDLFARVCSGEVIDLQASFKKSTQYFPTPESVLEEMCEYLSVGRGDRVLEPSAGEGAICDHLRVFFRMDDFDWDLDVCEMHPPFQELLRRKGLNLVGTDFLEMPRPDRGYHKIVANPPFSKGQDIQHFLKMYDLLAPGGRIVTVMSVRWRTANDKASLGLRDWLESFYHSVIDLPKGAFRKSGTDIPTCLLIVDKPLDEEY